MRVLMVSWEYPPLLYGGLGRHVQGLSEALAADGHDVAVISQAGPGTLDDDRTPRGVRVVRVPSPPRRDDFARWVARLNRAQARAGRTLLRSWRPDVVHAHDWVAAAAGVSIARAAGMPLVATIHATEAGLWNGWLTKPLSRKRHDMEAWLVREAARTIVCSAAMREEVSAALAVPTNDLVQVHNAVDPAAWHTTGRQRDEIRHRAGIPADAPLLVLAGRVEWEKGGDVAVRALPHIRRAHPGTNLVIAGSGSQRPTLTDLARRQRVARAVRLTGHLDQPAVAALLGTADVALVPSSYEPFGLVALEASAAGTPVVAGAAGGLPEIVTHGENGLLVPPRDPRALADAVTGLLADPDYAAGLVRTAQRAIEAWYVWPITARETEKVYHEAVADPRPARPRPRPVRPGNVFTGERT